MMVETPATSPSAREMWRVIDTYHAVLYFAPERSDAYQEAGIVILEAGRGVDALVHSAEASKYHGKPIYIGDGEKDANLPMAREAEKFYKDHGADVTLEVFKGIGHATDSLLVQISIDPANLSSGGLFDNANVTWRMIGGLLVHDVELHGRAASRRASKSCAFPP